MIYLLKLQITYLLVVYQFLIFGCRAKPCKTLNINQTDTLPVYFTLRTGMMLKGGFFLQFREYLVYPFR
jgi:hypothetical protein